MSKYNSDIPARFKKCVNCKHWNGRSTPDPENKDLRECKIRSGMFVVATRPDSSCHRYESR